MGTLLFSTTAPTSKTQGTKLSQSFPIQMVQLPVPPHEDIDLEKQRRPVLHTSMDNQI